MSDKTIKCVDCGADFVFTEREQEWYREKGLTHEPRRCKNCRSTRKTGGEGSHGHEDHAPHAPSSSPDRPQRPPARVREMHIVACATCSKETEVPFKPDPSRPVYCRECYAARGKKR